MTIEEIQKRQNTSINLQPIAGIGSVTPNELAGMMISWGVTLEAIAKTLYAVGVPFNYVRITLSIGVGLPVGSVEKAMDGLRDLTGERE